MGVSTKGVFHYTKSIDNIIKILSDGFFPSYCKEDIGYGIKKYSYAIPMISFCDIPLTEIQYHTDKYGSFAIGFTREWAIKNKLNPVVYLDNTSILASGLEKTLDFIFLDWHEWLDNDDFENFYNNAYKGAISIIQSSKNFEGKLTRDGIERDYNFYKEREWRYIPQIEDEHVTEYPDIFWEEDFDDLKNRFKIKPHFKHYGISIKSNDIKYLIIPYKKHLNELLNKLKDINGLYENELNFNYLITNIITIDKIKDDF